MIQISLECSVSPVGETHGGWLRASSGFSGGRELNGVARFARRSDPTVVFAVFGSSHD